VEQPRNFQSSTSSTLPPKNPSRLEALGDPSLLLRLSRSQLRGLWLETQTEMRGAQLEVGLLTARLARDKIVAWNRSPGTSVAARDKDADSVTIDLACALTEARTQLLALETERDLYAFALGMVN
jgi:hypothetical protein